MTFFSFQNEVRIILLGRTGSGISASGNSILKDAFFRSETSGSSVTKECCIGTTTRPGTFVRVVDTPGFFGNILTKDEIRHEIVNCLTLISPGPHIILYILRIGRFTDEDVQGVRSFLEIFGGNPLQHTILLFTGVDDLECDQSNREDYLKNAPICLRALVKDCNFNCVFFNNRLSKCEDNQVTELFTIVEEILKKNQHQSYNTNQMLERIKEESSFIAECKREHEKCTQLKTKQLTKGGAVLATGILAFGVTGLVLLPMVGMGIGIGLTYVSYRNDLQKAKDKLSKVIDEIKEERILQCSIS